MTKHFKSSDPPVSLSESRHTEPPSVQQPPEPPVHRAPAPETPEAAQEPAPVAATPAPEPAHTAKPPITAPPPPPQDLAPSAPEPTARRSSRARHETDKLQISWGTKSYAQAVSGMDPGSIGIRDSLHHKDPRGEGGITEYGIAHSLAQASLHSAAPITSRELSQ